MCKTLNPRNDLRFVTNAQSGSGPQKKGEHLQHRSHSDHKLIADPGDHSPFRAALLHVIGKNDTVVEKVDALSNAVIEEDWINFETIHHELLHLNPGRKVLQAAYQNLMADTVTRCASTEEITVLRRKLLAVGATDETLDHGYDAGWSISPSSRHQRPK